MGIAPHGVTIYMQRVLRTSSIVKVDALARSRFAKLTAETVVLRQAFDIARDGGDDWVDDRFYKGKKIE